MRTRLIRRCGVILAIATLLSSAVLVGPAQAQDGPSNPGRACAVVDALPLPQLMIDALKALLGCGIGGSDCPPNCL